MNPAMRKAGSALLSAGNWVAPQFTLRALATQSGDSLTRADLLEKAKEVATTFKQDVPTVVLPGQAFVGDYRSTSALGVGDGVGNHTAKWMQKDTPGTQISPLEFVQAIEPIKVDGHVVASTGSDHPGLGAPVEYINLKGTTRENPAVCKYTGNRYYSSAWKDSPGSH